MAAAHKHKVKRVVNEGAASERFRRSGVGGAARESDDVFDREDDDRYELDLVEYLLEEDRAGRSERVAHKHLQRAGLSRRAGRRTRALV